MTEINVEAPGSTWNIPNTILGNFAKIFVNIGVIGIFCYLVLEGQERNYAEMKLTREMMLEETRAARRDYREDLKEVRARYDESRKGHMEVYQMIKYVYEYHTNRPIREETTRTFNKK